MSIFHKFSIRMCKDYCDIALLNLEELNKYTVVVIITIIRGRIITIFIYIFYPLKWICLFLK